MLAVMRLRRKSRRKSSNGGGSPEWMTTYSDMVTLLLAFFVLLYSFSNIDLERFRAVMSALQGSLGVLTGGKTISEQQAVGNASLDLEQTLNRTRQELERMQRLYQDFSSLITELGLEARVEVIQEQRGLVVRFADSVFFDSGEATLKPPARGILEKVTGLLLPIQNHVRVEGHTDNVPIHNQRFPSNWELSTARATTVLRYMIEEHGFPPERLSAAGYGEFRPVADNATERGRAQNRRVDLVILRPDLQSGEPVAAWPQEGS